MFILSPSPVLQDPHTPGFSPRMTSKAAFSLSPFYSAVAVVVGREEIDAGPESTVQDWPIESCTYGGLLRPIVNSFLVRCAQHPQ